MRSRRYIIRVISALGFLALAGCRHPGDTLSAGHSSSLPSLIVERLSLAREVAWAKFHSGAPLPAAARAAALLEDFVKMAAGRGVDTVYARRFFTAQLEASRAAQAELLAAWRADAAPRPDHPPHDLRAYLRPRLDEVTARLARMLPTGAPPPLAAVTATELRRAAFSPAVIALATAPLR